MKEEEERGTAREMKQPEMHRMERDHRHDS